MFKTLSGRFLFLTVIFVLLAEVFIFVPSVARYRQDYLSLRLERAQIASLALLADGMISDSLEKELLDNAGVFNVVLRRDEVRELALSSPIPSPIVATYDLRDDGAVTLISDALSAMFTKGNPIIRVIGNPVQDGGLLIEVTMEQGPLRQAMLEYGLNVFILSAAISIITAMLLFVAVRTFLVAPIKGVVRAMSVYAEAPDDARRIINPTASVAEIREAEDALRSMQTQLTSALKQRERLAQLGEGVAKVSHDLRNILTSAQLFTDRIEVSTDPVVQRLAPKLVNSITRAVHLCENTLAFGRASEPPPNLTRFALAEIVSDVIDSERLSAGDYDISFAEDIPASMTVRADSEQLYRVIGNLVRNARQAIMNTGDSGEISIQASEDESRWRIVVADTGPGLPMRAKEHLFQAFHGGASKGGSGLGLVIASELIRGHGGQLDLLSTGPEGTTFEIILPKSDFQIISTES